MTANDKPGSASAPGPSQGKDVVRQLLWGLIFFAVILAVIIWTSAPPLPHEDLDLQQELTTANENPPQPPEAEQPPFKLPPETQPVSNTSKARVSIESLGDEQTGWLRITAQSTSGRRSSAVARYRAENEFEVDTVNVDRFELDLSLLPVNRTRRFILHIDGQDMLLFPKTMGTIEFARSPEGTWEKQ